MAHNYISGLYHVVFSTKERANAIPAAMQQPLWQYIGGIARKNQMRASAVGGTSNHAHVLIDIPATMSVSKAVQLIKGGSSKWMHEETGQPFQWQDGYGAFSVGVSQKPATITYITSQERHHARRSFEQEYLAFLKRHGIRIDSKYLWG
jgi:putative transposase